MVNLETLIDRISASDQGEFKLCIAGRACPDPLPHHREPEEVARRILAPKSSAACVGEPGDRGEAPCLRIGEEEKGAIAVDKGQGWLSGERFLGVLLREESRKPVGGILFIVEV